jgi:hypothetical protein
MTKPPVDKAWLYEHYVEKNMTLMEMSKICDYSVPTLWKASQNYGLGKKQLIRPKAEKEIKMRGPRGPQRKVSKEWLIDHHVNQGLTYQEIGSILGVSRQRVEQMMRRYDLKNVRDNRLPSIIPNTDHITYPHAFRDIDSEEKAYWLGFLRGKARIEEYGQSEFKKQKRLHLSAMNNVEHLEKFKAFLGSNVPIRIENNKKESYDRRWLIISNHDLCIDLESHFVGIKKCDHIAFPCIQEKYYRHYIRGYFEGKGSVFAPIFGHSVLRLEIRGNKRFLVNLVEYLKSLDFNIESTVRFKQYTGGWAFLSSRTQFIVDFLTYLYSYSNVSWDEKRMSTMQVIEHYGGNEDVHSQTMDSHA